MIRTALALAGTAALFAGVDLANKAAAEAPALHERSTLYVVFVVAGSIAWAGAIVVMRSLPIAIAGGVLLGGTAGNVLSLVFWSGVPDPIALGTIAFNLADLFVLAGLILVCGAALGFSVAHRGRLREPVRLR